MTVKRVVLSLVCPVVWIVYVGCGDVASDARTPAGATAAGAASGQGGQGTGAVSSGGAGSGGVPAQAGWGGGANGGSGMAGNAGVGGVAAQGTGGTGAAGSGDAGQAAGGCPMVQKPSCKGGGGSEACSDIADFRPWDIVAKGFDAHEGQRVVARFDPGPLTFGDQGDQHGIVTNGAFDLPMGWAKNGGACVKFDALVWFDASGDGACEDAVDAVFTIPQGSNGGSSGTPTPASCKSIGTGHDLDISSAILDICSRYVVLALRGPDGAVLRKVNAPLRNGAVALTLTGLLTPAASYELVGYYTASTPDSYTSLPNPIPCSAAGTVRFRKSFVATDGVTSVTLDLGPCADDPTVCTVFGT